VAIGLAVVYLTLSLFCSTINEWIARIVRLRSYGLRNAIGDLLQDGGGLVKAFNDHALIQGLQKTTEARWFGWKYPTYIPSQTFALAIMDIAIDAPPVGLATVRGQVNSNAATTTPASRTLSIDARAQSMLTALIADVAADKVAVRKRLEQWFDDAMERVSGVYKRTTQIIILIIACLVVLGFNVDTVRITRALLRDANLRTTVDNQANAIIDHYKLEADTTKTFKDRSADADKGIGELSATKIPMGWSGVPRPGDPDFDWWTTLAGWLLSMFALSLGAPFWFDLLGKLVNLRQTGTPPDELDAKAARKS
jgi:hypothetical protein